jgi:acetyl esterase
MGAAVSIDALRAFRIGVQWGAVDRALRAIARVGYLVPSDQNTPERSNVVVERDVAYTTTGRDHHLLDVYMPTRAQKPIPVVMYVHGGGFAMLSKDTHRVMALAIARRGYLVFNINYRLGPRHTFPAPLEDACRALLWVNENCARFGGDRTRIAIGGESAGGNLVTALAVAHSFERPEPFARAVHEANIALRAVVATYGFLDIGYIDRYRAHPKIPFWAKSFLYDAARAYVGADVARGIAAAPLASPLRILEGDDSPARALPPFFVSVGTRDPLFACSRRLKSALDRRESPCELHVSQGEAHGYDALTWRAPARAKWRAAHAFLKRSMSVLTDDA